MNKILLVLFLSTLAFAGVWFLFACTDSDDDDDAVADRGVPVDDSEFDDAACEGNSAPELLGVTAVVNGNPVEMPATIQSTDALELWLEYADADCNLEGGGASFIVYSEDDDASGGQSDLWSFDDIGCSSAEEGGPFVLPTDVATVEGMGNDPFQLIIADACGAQSNGVTLQFTVVDPV